MRKGYRYTADQIAARIARQGTVQSAARRASAAARAVNPAAWRAQVNANISAALVGRPTWNKGNNAAARQAARQAAGEGTCGAELRYSRTCIKPMGHTLRHHSAEGSAVRRAWRPSDGTRARMSAAGKRQPPRSAEVIAKMVASRKASGYTASAETRARISASNRGRRHPPEVCARIAVALRAAAADPMSAYSVSVRRRSVDPIWRSRSATANIIHGIKQRMGDT